MDLHIIRIKQTNQNNVKRNQCMQIALQIPK